MAKTASLSRGQRRVQRALEVAPGALTWTILIAPVVASFIFAPYIAVAMLAVDIYWFLRTGMVVVGIRRTYRKMKRAMNEDWWQRCLALTVSSGAPDPRRIIHAVLIPTYTEPYQILHETVRAIADADPVVRNERELAAWRPSERMRRLGHLPRRAARRGDP